MKPKTNFIETSTVENIAFSVNMYMNLKLYLKSTGLQLIKYNAVYILLILDTRTPA